MHLTMLCLNPLPDTLTNVWLRLVDHGLNLYLSLKNRLEIVLSLHNLNLKNPQRKES